MTRAHNGVLACMQSGATASDMRSMRLPFAEGPVSVLRVSAQRGVALLVTCATIICVYKTTSARSFGLLVSFTTSADVRCGSAPCPCAERWAHTIA